MNGRDNRDDHLFLWCAFLVFVFVLLPALYVVYADDVNRPLPVSYTHLTLPTNSLV